MNGSSKNKINQAVILTGGIGVRLRPRTYKIPKPMIKIGGKPILEHLVTLLKNYGIRDIIICTGHLSKVIEEYFDKGKKWDVRIEYSKEEKPLGTAGCVKEIKNEINEDFLVLYGDIMLNMDIKRLINFHFTKKGVATLVVHPNDHPYDSDLVEVNPDSRIINFLSKPHSEGLVYRNLVSAALYVLSPKVLDYIPKGIKSDFVEDVFPKMLKVDEKIFAYSTSEYLKDIGNLKRLNEVQQDFNSGKIIRFNLSNKRPTIFLDRDGVINREVDLLHKLEDIELLPNVTEAIKKINQTDYLAIIITNQPGVAKGLCSIEDVNEIHKKIETLLGKKEAKIDGIYYCPHHPDKGHRGENPKYKIICECRKPKIGMIIKAKEDFNIDFDRSFLIGDRIIDIETAKNANIYSIGVRCGYGCKDRTYDNEPTFWADDLLDAIKIILSYEKFSKHNNYIVSMIKKSNKKPFIIAIGGVARSGKSVFSRYVQNNLKKNNFKTTIVNMDNWIIPLSQRNEEEDVLERYQMDKFEKDITKLLSGDKLKLKKYNALTRELNDKELTYDVQNNDVVIIEGVCVLNSQIMNEFAGLKVYLEINEKDTKKRFYNFYNWKGLRKKDIDDLYQSRMNDEIPIIKKGKRNADIIIKGDYDDN